MVTQHQLGGKAEAARRFAASRPGYAVLDALPHAEAGGDGFITVTSLAGFIDRKVQDVSYAAFHVRQIPHMTVVKSSFPVAHRLETTLVVGDDTTTSPGPARSPG